MYCHLIKFRGKQILIVVIFLITLTIPIVKNYVNINKHDSESTFLEENETVIIHSAAFFSDFKYYKEITIDSSKVIGGANLINFPLLISIYDTDLHTNTQSGGDDIAFANETDWLDFEIELFNRDYNTTHARLIAWVRIPSLSSTIDTVIRMYFDNLTISSKQNPQGVWDTNYYAVYHMIQDPSVSSVLDSTANNYDLNSGPGFTSGDSINGIIGKAIRFNRQSDEYLNISSGFSNPTNSLSLELWFKPQQLGAFQRYFTAVSDYYPEDICFRDVNILRTRIKNNLGNATVVECNFTGWNTNQFYHFVMTWEGGSVGRNIHYLNGVLNRNVTDANALGTASPWSGFFMGTDLDCSDPSNMIIEEFRITSSVRSPDWFQTEYNNQFDPISFYTIGSPIEVDLIPPTINIISPSYLELFGSIAPNFTVEIGDDDGLSYMWYTLNNSVETYFTTNGTISPSIWSTCGNGTLSIKFYANDSLGNQDFSEVIVQKEISAPTINIKSPNFNDLFGNTSPSFNVEIWDNNSVIDMWYTLNNGIETFFFTNGTINQTRWDERGNGTVSIKFYANNSLGNGGFSEVILRKDVIGPVITISNPDDDDIYGTQAPSYNAIINEPNGVESKWYTLDGGTTNTTFISDGTINQTRWDERGNGSIIIRFYAQDSIGNEGFSDVYIYKDIMGPEVYINSPSPNEIFGYIAPNFSIQIIDGNGISLRWYNLNNGDNLTCGTTGAISSSQWIYQPNGTVTIKFFAMDFLGNENFSEVIVRKDIDPPSINISTPILDQIFGESPPSFNVEITDTNGIDSMWYSFDRGFTNTVFTTNGSIDSTIWDSFGDGNLELRFYVNNSIGSVAYSEVTIIKDIFAPWISINNPNNNSYWNHAPVLNIYSYDINFDNLWIRIGTNNVSISNNVNFQLNSSIWNSLAQGPFQISIYANDTIGHINSTIMSLYKDTINPSIPNLLISPSGEVSLPITFDWEDGNDASGISYYRLIIDNEADPFTTTGFTFEINITNHGSASSYYELTEFLSPRNYYYFIYSVDSAGNQGNPATGTFIIAGSSGTPAEFPWWIILIVAIPLGLAIAVVALRKSKKVKVVVIDKEVELLKEQKKQLEMKARSALKAGNYQDAADLFSQCRNISNQLLENGVVEEKDKFRNYDKIEKELQLKLAAIPLTYSCINYVMTAFFDELGIKYYSNPDIYPKTQGIINGLILNDSKFLERRLTNPENGEKLINDLGLQLDKTSHINGIQFLYTNDLTEESLIKMCTQYQNLQMLLLIVGVEWPSFEYDESMAIPRDTNIKYRDNIRIINNDLFIRFLGIEANYKEVFTRIIEANFDYIELEALLKKVETPLHDTTELKEDLKKMEWFFFL